MKILAFSDLHASITSFKKLQQKIKKYNPDYIFCLGDFTVFEQNIEAVLEKINDFKKPTIVLHGNHEQDVIVKKLCKKHSSLTFMHCKVASINGCTVVVHGGGGFYGGGKVYGDKRLDTDREFDKFIRENKTKLKGKIILLTHAPPGYTKLDYLKWMKEHRGCASYGSFIRKYKPVLALSGHLHEHFGVKQKLGKTLICNPGPEGMIFEI